MELAWGFFLIQLSVSDNQYSMLGNNDFFLTIGKWMLRLSETGAINTTWTVRRTKSKSTSGESAQVILPSLLFYVSVVASHGI